jgi:tetratricopeptide (TPR) repeat protein
MAPGKRIFPILAVCFLALPGLPLAAQGAESGPRAEADAFLLNAHAALDARDLGQAGLFAASALEIAPDYSEALYLQARVEAADRASTRKAIQHLQDALRRSTWAETDPLGAEQLLADLLLRTGQNADARRAAERLAARRPEDPLNFVLLARAQDREGSVAAEERTLTTALDRFPRNEQVRLSAARLLQQQGRSAEASAVIRTGLRLQPSSPPLLLAAAGLEIDRENKVSDVDMYLANGGTDPSGPVLGMEAVSIGKRRRYLDRFISLGGLSRQDLVSRAVDAVKGSSDLTALLRVSLSRYTGNRDLDADLDGLWEERWLFENGKVVRWIREPAQDGVALYSAEFEDGRPVSLESRDASGVLTRFVYSRYPFVEKADVQGQGTFLLVPYTLQCAFLRLDTGTMTVGAAPRVAGKFAVPSADALRRGAYQLQQFGPDGSTLVRKIDLAGGQPQFMEESEAGDGVLDHRMWYSQGQPERGARSLSRDGIFQVTESWKNGRMVSEVIDTDGDGTPDYRETFGVRPMRSWDFDEDGRDDSREYDMPDGTRIRELATKLDGVFDLKIVTRGTRIASITRAGRPSPVSPDAARGVTWIGLPAPPGGIPDTSLSDGYQTIAGRQYLVFRLGGIVYAEAVQE